MKKIIELIKSLLGGGSVEEKIAQVSQLETAVKQEVKVVEEKVEEVKAKVKKATKKTDAPKKKAKKKKLKIVFEPEVTTIHLDDETFCPCPQCVGIEQ